MKTLIFMRHAHPQYGYGLNDVERPLTDEGRKAATDMAVFLQRNDFIPERILTSHAKRAMETTEIVADCLGVELSKVTIHEKIYFGYTTDDMLSIIHSIEDEVSTLMIIGHNPDISVFAGNMSMEHGLTFPPAGVVVMTVNVDRWNSVEPRQATIVSFNSPRRN